MAKEMKDSFADDFCVGIIDEDRNKNELDYLKEFDLMNETNSLKLWKHKDKHHYIIQLRPVIENWIISACRDVGITLKSYGLPESLKDLLRLTKAVTSKRDQRFIQLFKDLLKKESVPVLQLKQWLEYLKTNKYNADINQLTNG